MIVLEALIAFVSSVVGSLAALAIWFHYDLEGYWDQHRHERIIKRGRKLEERHRVEPVRSLADDGDRRVHFR